MVQTQHIATGFTPAQGRHLFTPMERPTVTFPIQSVVIDWDRLQAKRAIVLDTTDAMPAYLLKPEINLLLDAEKDPTYRLIYDLMWTTGARISEVLALTPEHFTYDGYDYSVTLKTLKQGSGRPTKKSLARSKKRNVPIVDVAVQNRIQSYLYTGHFRKMERIFRMKRQTVWRHIQRLVERVGGAPFPISTKTFRHSFAVHLILHGRPLKIVSKLLGHSSIQTTEIYTNVLTVDAGHFLEGVDFH